MRSIFLFTAAALLVGGGACGVPVSVEMPFDGKVTVAIDRADGTRVRNLVCGRACQKGLATFEWDCKGEDGAFVEPGDYRLRVLAHPGLSYDFLGSFGNGGEKLFQPYGPNHMTFRALAARKGEICASAFFTEGGNSTVVLKNDGSLKWGVCEIWGNGNRELFHVSGDSDFFYAVREDKAGDQSQLLLFAYSWERAERPQLRLPKTGVKRAGVFRAAPLAGRKRKTLGGAAFDGGRLYVSDALAGGVSVYPLAEDAGARRDAWCVREDDSGRGPRLPRAARTRKVARCEWTASLCPRYCERDRARTGRTPGGPDFPRTRSERRGVRLLPLQGRQYHCPL